MLRAFRWAKDPNFDGRHDLKVLMKQSGVLGFLKPDGQIVVSNALNEIAVRWSVSHRYAPSDRLESYLKNGIGMKGKNVLNQNADLMIRYTQVILAECDQKCP